MDNRHREMIKRGIWTSVRPVLMQILATAATNEPVPEYDRLEQCLNQLAEIQ